MKLPSKKPLHFYCAKNNKTPSPKESGPVLELWRQEIEQKAAAELNELTHHIHNQHAFARIVRQMLFALKMSVQREETSDNEKNKIVKNEGELQNQSEEESNNEKKHKVTNKQQQNMKAMRKTKEKRKQHNQMTMIKLTKNKT